MLAHEPASRMALEVNSAQCRTRQLRNVQRIRNEMREAAAWQRAAVGVAVREGTPQIANASVDVRSDSDVQTPSRDVAWRTGGHKVPIMG